MPTTLQELKGQHIVAKISGLTIGSTASVHILKLVEIEDAGIWVESEEFTKYLLTLAKLATTPKAPVFFVPYAQICWIFAGADYPALLEKGFGL
jgi:hypothetical protein